MTTTKRNSILRQARCYIMIALGLLLYALAWNIFLYPHHVAGGGGTGVATIVMYATRGALTAIPILGELFGGMYTIDNGIPVSVTFLLMNVILLGVAVKIFGWEFSLRSVYGVVMLSIWLAIPYEQILINLTGLHFPKFDDVFMSSIIAGLIAGIGMAFVLTNNGSSGGTDIIAKIINKYCNVTLGRSLLLCDLVVICSVGFTPEGNIEKIVYGLIMSFTMTTTIDMYINGARQSVQFFIFSKKHDEIAEAISQEAHRGVTLLDGTGWYTKEQVKVVTVLVRKNESTNIFKIVKGIDPNAFISQSAAIGVYGKGFDQIGQK